MNNEIKMLTEQVKPLLLEVADRSSIKFSTKASEYLSQVYMNDETANFVFNSFVTASTVCGSCGGITLTTATQLEQIYRDTPSREKELLENRILLFAIDGDGSFFGFGLDSRLFYHFDFGPWVDEELPWDQCCSDQWDTSGFCDFFVEEYELNTPL